MRNNIYKKIATKYSNLFWNEWELNPKKTDYNIIFSYKLQGDFDVERLQDAVNNFIKARVFFRSYFEHDEENLYQIIMDEVPTYEIENILMSDANEISVKEKISEKGNEPFDLTKYPLFKIFIIKTDDSTHYLTMVAHHIIADGGAFCDLRNSISSFYNNKSWEVDDDKALYLSYLDDEYKSDSFSKKTKDLNYWGEALESFDLSADTSNLDSKLEIKNERLLQSNIKFNLNRDDFLKLNNFLEEDKTSVFAILSSIWSTLLMRYLNLDNAVFSFMSNPKGKKYKNLNGGLVNNLLLPISKETNLSLSDLCQNVGGSLRKMLRHSKISFGELVSFIRQQGKIKNGTKPFNLAIIESFLSSDYKGLNFNDIDTSYFYKEAAFIIYDLCLEYSVDDDTIFFELHYNGSKFSREIANQLSKDFIALLQNSILKPQLSPYTHNLLSNIEYNKIIHDWNSTEEQINYNSTLKDLFEKQVLATPNNIALIFEDEEITYTELNNQANKVAHALVDLYRKKQNKNVDGDTIFGVYIERSVNMIVAILAILKTGAAYVPLDDQDPIDRTTLKINDCGCDIVVTSNTKLEALSAVNNDLITLSIDTCENYPNSNLLTNIKPNDLAYVIYTSGSTGTPKGVMIENRMVINTLKDINNKFDIDESDRSIMISSLSFDLSVYDIFGMFICGGGVVLPSLDEKNDFTKIVEIIEKYKVSIWNSVPQLFSLIIDYGLPVSFIKNMKKVLLSGDWLDTKLIYRLVEIEKCQCIVSLGGATEGSIWSIFNEVGSVDPLAASISYGKPLGNQKAYVLDDMHNPVPVGVIGEYYIGGIGVARGYMNRPDLNSTSFIVNPLYNNQDSGDSEIIYKTGDLVRWSTDGSLEFIGRSDDQVKLNGFRVELGEIESKISEYPKIESCVVNSYKNSNSFSLCAFYKSNDDLNNEEIKNFLLGKLPTYMIPTSFVKVENFPLTPTGKLNRKALVPPAENEILIKEIIEPKNKYEQDVCQIWEEMLDTDQIGVCDNFFNIGGDSLSAIKAAHKLSKLFQQKVLPADIFEYPTIREICDNFVQDSFVIEEGEL
ncbi:non-ribosomal peptide synthetase [Francisella uliginis]|uniref:Carrier domain-containing protein n=1 Tax=Francisella uliginis TaxID=573570 RepID=A0A1L4BS48_9GAMM|nr:non-ribosomal peptide synthetase [Francisella uliginis]API86658.1 hypothetical protein F7310_04460 [Francisella uliginis]